MCNGKQEASSCKQPRSCIPTKTMSKDGYTSDDFPSDSGWEKGMVSLSNGVKVLENYQWEQFCPDQGLLTPPLKNITYIKNLGEFIFGSLHHFHVNHCAKKNTTISRLLPLQFWCSEGHLAQFDLILTFV